LADELATLPPTPEGQDTRGWTGFHQAEFDGVTRPFLYNYVARGLFKEACGHLRRHGAGKAGTLSAKLSAHRKVINGAVFITPRRIPLILPEGALLTFVEQHLSDFFTLKTNKADITDHGLKVLERALRASTPQGERVSLVRSDVCPQGTRAKFQVSVLGEGDSAVIQREHLEEWLGWAGAFGGFGQWRSGGYGQISYQLSAGETKPLALVAHQVAWPDAAWDF
jgi:hypothetical protein